MSAQTLYDKLWSEHVVRVNDDGTALLYIARSPSLAAGGQSGGARPQRAHRGA